MSKLVSRLAPPIVEWPARTRCRGILGYLGRQLRRGALPLAVGVLAMALLAGCAPGSVLPPGTGRPSASSDRAASRALPAGAQGAPASGSAPEPAAPAALDRQGNAPAGSAARPPATAQGQAAMPLPDAASVDRMIVKTGALTVQVRDLAAAVAQVDGIVAAIPGAYVAASTTSYRASSTPPAGTSASGAPVPAGGASRQVLPIPPGPTPPAGSSALLVLKVPAESFSDAVQRLRDLGMPLYESLGTQEVTEEYVDLDAQVRNLEATEQQYLSLLGRAQKIDEILQIQQRLTDVQGQIERLKGRMQLLQRRSAMATISLTLVLPAAGTQPAGEARALRTLRAAWAALLAVLERVLDLAIYVAVFALPLLPLGAATVWWWRRSRRPLASAGGAV